MHPKAGIVSFGAYLPKLRLQRQAIAAAHAWSDPAMAAQAKGERSMCNWDEDTITMAVEAVRDCQLSRSQQPDQLILAATSAPFSDRQNAGIVAAALGVGHNLASMDVSGSQRAGTSALLQGTAGVLSGLYKHTIVVASDKRKSRAAGLGEMRYGDGAAALMLGSEDCLAEFVDSATVTTDFVDHYRLTEEKYDYQWEERWIRDEGYGKIVPKALTRVLEKSGTNASEINHFVMPGTIARAVQTAAKKCGIPAAAIASSLHELCGETGVAHPLIMLIHTLQNKAKAGDLILVAGFGQGCDVILYRVTDAIENIAGGGVNAALAHRHPEDSYQKYLTFNELVDRELGIRAESRGYNTALSVLYRKGDMLTGLIGGKCTQCSTAQFPRTEVCVNPQCRNTGAQEPYPFQDRTASVLSWSADYLAYTPNPPARYGMITFAEGGRFMADFTDVTDAQELEVGSAVKMVFRIKSRDPNRGFIRYFWKATPIVTAG